MKNIFSLKYDELEAFLVTLGEKKYRTKQIYEWLYQHKVFAFSEMSNLSKESVDRLSNNLSNEFIKIKEVQASSKTSKYLFELSDNNYIEAVLMRHDYGNSLCVSSQVGCNMGCEFCESGRLKKVRDLSADEMVQQVLLIEMAIGERVDSVVIMGIGEPLDNYDNVLSFIRIINSPFGLAIGARHITLSTCGIIPKIEKLAEEELQVNLAISLHAPNDELRNKLMRINQVYSIPALINALKAYTAKTNRRITIEYVMLMYINDSEELAGELAKLIKGMNVYVNLIPYNETSHLDFKKSNAERIQRFYNILKEARIDVTIRREFGGSIDAACGQLRSERSEK